MFEGEKDMSQTKQFIMTYEGVKKLEEELEYLKTVKRKEITEKIKVALGYGDLSENSEYDEAKTVESTVEIAVQINGKTKATINIAKDADKDSVIAAAKEALGSRLSGNIIKEIYVPGRIVNIVAK